jgi:hypothetical protein
LAQSISHRFIATPISRPKSRREFSHRWIAVAIAFSSPLQSSEILSVAWPCCLQIVIASVFSELVANRIAPDTHRDQACRDVTHVCPGGYCRPRETLVPDEVQWVSQNRGCCLAQRQSMVAHRPGDPVIDKQAVGQREDPIKTMAFHQSHYRALSPCTTVYPKQRTASNGLCSRSM